MLSHENTLQCTVKLRESSQVQEFKSLLLSVFIKYLYFYQSKLTNFDYQGYFFGKEKHY